ncbi:hypothetical protein BG004_007370 [Podila humilis]|nr:hypothetical protein BG004_007370 [Podila humilis]
MNYESTLYAQDGNNQYTKEQGHTYEAEAQYSATSVAEMEMYEHGEYVQTPHPPSESEGAPDSPQYEQSSHSGIYNECEQQQQQQHHHHHQQQQQQQQQSREYDGQDRHGEYQHPEESYYHQNQQQEVLNNPTSKDASYEEPVVSTTTTTMESQQQQQTRISIDILPSLDITYELKFFKDRLASITRDNDLEEEPERQALLEIVRSTETLIASRKVLSEHQQHLAAMAIDDSNRAPVQAEVALLLGESKIKERQWTTNKEAYYREFSSGTAVVIVSSPTIGADGIPEPLAAAPRQLSPAEAEMRARTESEIEVLLTQIAQLQRQLDAVSTRRKQIALDAEAYQRMMEPRPYGLSTFALQSPASPLIVLNSQPELTHGGGGGGGGGGRRDEIAKFYACASSNARSVPIAQCPQNQCVQGYCAGGGPATVPRRLRGGDGLYCGRTIIHQLRRRRPGPALASDEAESPLKGGGDAFTVATNPTAPGRGGGGGDDSYDEYINDNLYYFAGSQGINLGPCETHCISAGRGQADYCEV